MKNPYEILGVDQNAPMKDIVKAMALAITRRQYSQQDIAAARVQLSTPAKRLAADFTFPIIPKDAVEKISLPEIEDMDVNTFDENKYDTLI